MWTFVVGGLTTTSAHAFELKEPSNGNFVRWRRARVELHVAAPPTSSHIDEEMLRRALGVATDAWRGIYGAPDLIVQGDAPRESNPRDGLNSVHVLDPWPATLGDRLAVTVSTYEVTGRLIDADILINGEYAFEILDEESPASSFDLPSVLTHEIGHVLGLDESNIEGATMWPNLRRGEVYQRSLELDDEEGIRMLYGEVPQQSHDHWLTMTCDASGAGPGTPAPSGLLAFVVFVAFGRHRCAAHARRAQQRIHR